MEEPKQPERRRFVRVEIVVPVKYRESRNDSVSQNNYNVGQSRDLSAGGIKYKVDKHKPVDTRLDMEIELPDSVPAHVIGKVVGGEDVVINGVVHHYDRVSFVDMDKDIQEKLMRQVLESMKKKG